MVLSTVAICGGGFDVATRGEVDLLGRLGLPLHRGIHTNPIKKPADIDHAYAAGIRTFVVENVSEVHKFAGRPADIDLLVRLAFANPTAKSDLSSKFGVTPADAELLVKHVLASGVGFAGFSFHVGSQSSSTEPFRRALRHTLDLTDHIDATLGQPTRVIDIGVDSRSAIATTSRPSPRSVPSSTTCSGRGATSSRGCASRVGSWPPSA